MEVVEVATIMFLSKAQTIEKLRGNLSVFKIPKAIVFSVSTWRDTEDTIVKEVTNFFAGSTVVVRSSASDEDGSSSARAGEYDSVLNVPSNNLVAIRAAIAKVIASYERNGPRTGDDEVIVQEMVLNTSLSGVVFTHDLNSGAPYYVINYDDVSGLTNTVTSGGGEYANRTLYIHRGASQVLRSERFQRLMQAIQELEKVMGSQFLDIEFALGNDFTPYLLQVRAITTQPNWNRAVTKRIDAALQGIQSFVRGRLQPIAGVYGKTTVLGQMPDWNPAEMIGRAPRALAFSLYKVLITDCAWRIAREKMGYAVPLGQPLMVSLAGQPFIDTRLSFHSYLPASISADVGRKLVDVWVDRLREHPELHDKVEFSVAITTYSFDLDEKLLNLSAAGIADSELRDFKTLLHKQTRVLLQPDSEGGITEALANVEALAKKQDEAQHSLSAANISAIFKMVDDCIRLGTVSFAILARHGFIARTILLSLHSRGLLTEEDVGAIQSSVKTVASTLVNDMRELQLGVLSRTHFMQRYGHLRPGTYDILSHRYDQMVDFGVNDSQMQPEHDHSTFSLSADQQQKINQLLIDEDFPELDADKLFEYIHAATAAREYGKFVFTRSVSDILELIAAFGEENGLSRDEMSHVSIDNLFDIVTKSSEGSIEERLRQIAEDEAERHAISAAIRLPQVLFDEAGVHVVPFQVSHPNFITHKKITAACVCLLAGEVAPSLTGKIVLIENADPGFDWIFSQQIKGLITKYGGANSHMAIRCAEFGIPAAIGCGEQRFDVFVRANQILLDCSAGLINPLH
ncbi:PEP-utilizing enzyme [Herminiimonas arsenitoxidans]|uniref:PEP-utilizing enzyme n=1 Tax=Herminiimonas arsenitoxidans TaxID=1809410 RepID=UPI000970FA60|nr:PEP/pyruvate-binding domain-containing protein [Herminiimonas arsenitoxidans]